MIEITYAILISFVGMGATYWMGRYSGQRDMEQIAGNLIEILERGCEVIHICSDPKLDAFNEKIWKITSF